jgi:hypothetical protein
MKRYLLMLGLLWLLTGCDGKTGTAEDVRLQEAIFRYQFTHNEAARRDEADIFCVELTTASKSARVDPPVELIKRLNDGKRKVLAGSSCARNQDGFAVERVSGKPVLILTVGNVVWSSATSVVVEGGYYEAPESASGNVYHVDKVNGVWRVTKDEMKWIA